MMQSRSTRPGPATAAGDRVTPWVILVAACTFFIANLDFTTNGDTIYYANIIDTLRFDQLTLHQGYYLIGFLFAQLTGTISGLATDQALTLMNALFGAGALAVGYLLMRSYLQHGGYALLGVLILVMCHRFFVNSTTGEIYIAQTFFIWSAYLLFEQRRFYTAGAAIGLGMWISPLTVAFCLLFPAVALMRGYGIRSLVRLGVPVLMIYLPFLYFHYEELLWGTRGLIVQDSDSEIDLFAAAHGVIKYQIKHYTSLNLLLLPALAALRREKYLLAVSAAAALPNLYVISQLRGEDNVFILTLDLFIVCWMVTGWRVLRERALTLLAAVLLAAHSVMFVVAERPFLDDSNTAYRDAMRELGRLVDATPDSLVIMNWGSRMAFIYFNTDRHVFPLEQGIRYRQSYDVEAILNGSGTTPADFAQYDTFFVLESYSASPQSRLLLSRQALEQRYEANSERRSVERFLDVTCEPRPALLTSLYQCRRGTPAGARTGQ